MVAIDDWQLHIIVSVKSMVCGSRATRHREWASIDASFALHAHHTLNSPSRSNGNTNYKRKYTKHLSDCQAPRGLSAEEKRVKLLEIFHESVSRFHFGSHQLRMNDTLSIERLLPTERVGKTRSQAEGYRYVLFMISH